MSRPNRPFNRREAPPRHGLGPADRNLTTAVLCGLLLVSGHALAAPAAAEANVLSSGGSSSQTLQPVSGSTTNSGSTGSDRITRFLQERGLLSASGAQVPSSTDSSGSPRFLDQVRDRTSDLVLTAMNFLGVPYRRGGTSEDTGFDCSGFTRHVFENSLGLLLPRRAQEQANASDLMSVRKEDLKPGDLVFFNTMRHAFSHVGIYIGDDKFIHSPRTGSEVRVEDMREAYWTKRFNGARRVPALSSSSQP